MKIYMLKFWKQILMILKIMTFNYRRKMAFFDKVYRLCSNEVNLQFIQVVEALREQEIEYNKRKTLLYYVYDDIHNQLSLGGSEAEALGMYISSVDKMMINSFSGDDISTGFRDLIAYNDKTREMNSALQKALAYPAFLFAFILLIIYYFSTSLIPSLTANLPVGAELSSTSEALMWLADNFWWFLGGIVGTIVTLVAVLSWMMPNYNGKFRVKLEQIPPFSIYRIVNGCGFLNSLSALSKAGWQQAQAIEEMYGMSKPYLAYRLNLIYERIKTGENLGEALVKIKLNFPDKEMLKDIALISQYGALEESLDKMSDEMTEEGLKIIGKQAMILKNTATFAVAGTIMFLFTGIYSLSQDMGNSVEASGK